MKLWQASKPAIEKKLAAQGIMVLFAVPWAPQGIYAKKELNTDRGHEGPEVARLQCRHRAHRRNGRRAGGDGPGGRTAAGAGDRRGQLVHVVGRRPATTSRSGRSLTHFYDTQAWIPKNVTFVNKAAFDALDKPTQEAVLKAAAAAEERGWKMWEDKTEWYHEQLAKARA